MKKVIVVAPGRPISPSVADLIGNEVEKQLGSISVDFDPSCFTSCGHFAGDDATRAASVQSALSGKYHDSVWMARGGYGAARILNKIDWKKVDKSVSVYGYSDGCFLLAALFRLGASSLYHSPMPIDITREGNLEHLRHVLRCISNDTAEQRIAATRVKGDTKYFERVYVSNLTVLTKLIGTKFEPKIASGLLIVEDVSEHEYSIDRMLFQLSNSRLGRSLAGIGFGSFSSIPKNDVEFNDDFRAMLLNWFPQTSNLFCDIRLGHIPFSPVIRLGHGLEVIS
jgi:muramoyltetrapeptide carboxypeptidase